MASPNLGSVVAVAEDWVDDLFGDDGDKPHSPVGPAAPMPEPGAGTAYGRAALAAEAAILAATPEGNRNSQLNISALRLGSLAAAGHLHADDIRAALRHAAAVAGLGAVEVEKTLASGLNAGLRQPRAVPDLITKEPVVTEVTADEIGGDTEPRRQLHLTPASEIAPRRVKWLWTERIPLGSLVLLAGREGVGKSTIAYWIAARITKGELPGERLGQPRGVLVCATEDSWGHTIVPRLIAAGADLTRVYRVEVTHDAVRTYLSLPRDVPQTMAAAEQVEAGLLLLDPLMSRLDSGLDSHRDHEVRQALEPVAELADRAGISVIGLIHHNKSGSADPLQLIMGSRAFSAVARAVLTVVPDPDDDTGERRLFGTPKSNLGRDDLPSMAFHVVSHPVETDEGASHTGRIEWLGDAPVSIHEAMRRSASDAREDNGSTAECTDWLRDYLESNGGAAESGPVKRAAQAAGHTDRALRRARGRLALLVESKGFPRVTVWTLPGTVASRDASRDAFPRGDVTTDMTDSTRGEIPSRDSRDSRDTSPQRVSPLTPTQGPRRTACAKCGGPLNNAVQQRRGTCGPCEMRSAA